MKSTYLADRFRSPSALNPDLDPHIVGPAAGIFTQAEYDADNEFRKTAAVMKMVINGYAGAGTVTMGGYDYHGQGRNTGETRNFRAGRCIGACLEYARAHEQAADDLRVQRRLAVGERHGQQHGRGSRQARLGQRQPVDRCVVRAGATAGWPASAFRNDARRQIGSMSAGGDVVTSSSPAANAVNLLVETVILNYMALHGEEGNFDQPAFFPRHGLGGTAAARRAHDARAGRATARSATRSDAARAQNRTRGSVGTALSRVADAPLPFLGRV